MYIEEVSIEGFKSYAKRVVVTQFDSSFNAITGLNGSGKSNILDAICFVLGIKNLSHVRTLLAWRWDRKPERLRELAPGRSRTALPQPPRRSAPTMSWSSSTSKGRRASPKPRCPSSLTTRTPCSALWATTTSRRSSSRDRCAPRSSCEPQSTQLQAGGAARRLVQLDRPYRGVHLSPGSRA